MNVAINEVEFANISKLSLEGDNRKYSLQETMGLLAALHLFAQQSWTANIAGNREMSDEYEKYGEAILTALGFGEGFWDDLMDNGKPMSCGLDNEKPEKPDSDNLHITKIYRKAQDYTGPMGEHCHDVFYAAELSDGGHIRLG
jgi:hypothetical protein